MFEFLKRDTKAETAVKPPKKHQMIRSFVGAKNSAMNRWNTTYARINQQLKNDYLALVLRSRDLAKNNQMVNSYINLMIRNVLGSQGFRLNVTAYNDDGSADTVADRIIENEWYEYTKSYKKYVSADECMNQLDFDKHILFNFLVDGQVFIRKIKDTKSKYTIRYEVVDSLDIDHLKNQILPLKGERIVMGIRVDQHNKPLSYFIRKTKNTDYYVSGDNEQVDASQIIHIYKRQYANQVRGITPLSAVIQCLNGLEEYKRAQINASLLNSCYMGIWEKNSTSSDNNYDEYEDTSIDSNGDVAVQIEQNIFRYAPDGYSLKSIQSNHPNSNVGTFLKSMIKGIASSLGVSSNKLNSDYESVNYSSLRQANQEDISAWRQLQQFLIDNWKNQQYADWLKYLLVSDLTNLPYSKIQKFMVHEFRGRSWEYLDPQKQFTSIKLKLDMKLTNPIMQIERLGYDADDVLDGWELWQQKLKVRNLKVEDTDIILQAVTNEQLDAVDDEVNKKQQAE